MDAILYGSNETFDVELKEAGLSKSYKILLYDLNIRMNYNKLSQII